jgi:hypothetical protein
MFYKAIIHFSFYICTYIRTYLFYVLLYIILYVLLYRYSSVVLYHLYLIFNLT